MFLVFSVVFSIYAADRCNSFEDDWVALEPDSKNQQLVRVVNLDGSEHMIALQHQSLAPYSEEKSNWADFAFKLMDKMGEYTAILATVPVASLTGGYAGVASATTVVPVLTEIIASPIGMPFVTPLIMTPVAIMLGTGGFMAAGSIAWQYGGNLYYVVKGAIKGTFWVIMKSAEGAYSMLPIVYDKG